jgi:hypothetical protein
VRGTPTLPWVTAVVLLVFPIAIADFGHRYLLPVLPFACAAAGLSFAPQRRKPAPPQQPSSAAKSRPRSPTRSPN